MRALDSAASPPSHGTGSRPRQPARVALAPRPARDRHPALTASGCARYARNQMLDELGSDHLLIDGVARHNLGVVVGTALFGPTLVIVGTALFGATLVIVANLLVEPSTAPSTRGSVVADPALEVTDLHVSFPSGDGPVRRRRGLLLGRPGTRPRRGRRVRLRQVGNRPGHPGPAARLGDGDRTGRHRDPRHGLFARAASGVVAGHGDGDGLPGRPGCAQPLPHRGATGRRRLPPAPSRGLARAGEGAGRRGPRARRRRRGPSRSSRSSASPTRRCGPPSIPTSSPGGCARAR